MHRYPHQAKRIGNHMQSLLRMTAVDGLGSLVDKSLVQAEAGEAGESRFTMLETLREYALEQLELSGETEAIRKRHAAYYLALAEAAEGERGSPRRQAWIGRLELEHDNMRSALRWALERGEVALGLQLAGALCALWVRHAGDWMAEGWQWVEQFLAVSNTTDPAIRATALYRAATLARELGDYRWVAALAQEGLTLCRL